jgi:hypothetical protein
MACVLLWVVDRVDAVRPKRGRKVFSRFAETLPSFDSRYVLVQTVVTAAEAMIACHVCQHGVEACAFLILTKLAAQLGAR